MLQNYFLIAFRVLKKNKLFSAINIIGLSIGLAASIIIFLWVYDELSFDRFHVNAGRIYRIERDMFLEGEQMHVPITSPPVGPQIKADYPNVEAFVRLARESVMVLDADKNQFRENFFYADSSFFDIFSFTVIEGDKKGCLAEPFTIAVSRSYARKYFGENARPGNVLSVNYNGNIRPYTVTAIFEDFPHNSHIQADLIGSFSSLFSLRHEMMMSSWMASNLYTYLLLSENSNAEKLEISLQEMVDKYFGPELKEILDFDNPREFMKLTLTPLTEIHLGGDRVWELESPGSRTSVMVFSLVSLLLLIIAGVNFMNLSIARASRRAMEVGVRKVSGATRHQLIWQFLGESALFSFSALVLSVLFVEIALPWFSLFTGKPLSVSLIFSGWNFPLILVVWLSTAFFAGAYPAFFLASYKPVDVLKGNKAGNGSQLFRRVLVIGQFIISIGLIVCSISVFRQIQYMNSKDLGYNRHDLIDIYVENSSNFSSYNAIRHDLLNIPGVNKVTRSMEIPGNLTYTDNPYLLRDNPETFFPLINTADNQYVPVFEISLLAGSNFAENMIHDTIVYYIINDEARKMFGFENAIDAISREIGVLSGVGGETRDWGQIVGVTSNFHFQPLTEVIKPMVISSSRNGHKHITLRVDESDMTRVNRLVEEVWSSHFPGQVYASSFVSQNFENLHLTERRLQVILLIFTFLSIFVACLGLLGLSSFSAERRLKEIGIRKAFGAEVYQIIILISSEFIRMVIISCLIALPLAYFILREWLNNFPYRREIELWVFFAAVLVGLLTALITVLIQTFRAGNVNPVETLKYE